MFPTKKIYPFLRLIPKSGVKFMKQGYPLVLSSYTQKSLLSNFIVAASLETILDPLSNAILNFPV